MTILKILSHPIIVLSLTIAAIIFFFSLDKSSKKTQSSSENIQALEYEVNQISQGIIDLEEQVAQTQSQQFTEKVVRNELLLQKPGEYVLLIPETEQNVQFECDKSNCQTNTKSITASPIQAWKELLF